MESSLTESSKSIKFGTRGLPAGAKWQENVTVNLLQTALHLHAALEKEHACQNMIFTFDAFTVTMSIHC
jgi:hypothetical protein